jgi:hypothetical protein
MVPIIFDYRYKLENVLIRIMSTEDFLNFDNDRISFKLHACRQHLRNLKDIELKYNDLTSNDVRMTVENGDRLNSLSNDWNSLLSSI